MKPYTHKILAVDDEPAVRMSLKMILGCDYDVLLAQDVFEGLICCSDNDIGVILLDINMPKKNGLDAIKDFKASYPYTEIILMTAYASVKSVQKALRLGASDYITKPFDVSEVKEAVEKAIKRNDQTLASRNEQYQLIEESIYLRNQIKKAERKAYQVLESSVTSMLLSISSKDNYTWEHSKRVSELSTIIANSMGIRDNTKNWLRCASIVHDLGKIMIPVNVLHKNDLSFDEIELVKRHVLYGAEILKDIHIFEKVIPYVLHHHERYDGFGYPDGLEGERIPLESRIIAVSDSIDAMMHSTYKRKYSREEVEQELMTHRGSQFDPSIVDLVLSENIVYDAIIKHQR